MSYFSNKEIADNIVIEPDVIPADNLTMEVLHQVIKDYADFFVQKVYSLTTTRDDMRELPKRNTDIIIGSIMNGNLPEEYQDYYINIQVSSDKEENGFVSELVHLKLLPQNIFWMLMYGYFANYDEDKCYKDERGITTIIIDNIESQWYNMMYDFLGDKYSSNFEYTFSGLEKASLHYGYLINNNVPMSAIYEDDDPSANLILPPGVHHYNLYYLNNFTSCLLNLLRKIHSEKFTNPQNMEYTDPYFVRAPLFNIVFK